MKSKKKMLLALGAMSAAAIGAGATSTFAWYTASTAVTRQNESANFTSIATDASSVSLGKLVLTPSFVAIDSDSAATLTGIELTNNAGKKGVVTGGGTATEAATDGCRKVFRIKVTASLDATAEAAGLSIQEAKKSVIDAGNGSVTVTVTPAGNVVVKKIAAASPTDSELTTASTGLYKMDLATADDTFTITLANDATAAWYAYYAVAVRTNNDSGKEYVTSTYGDATLRAKAQEIAAYDGGESYSAGDAVYNQASTDYAISTTANGSSWTPTGTYMHEADKLTAAIS